MLTNYENVSDAADYVTHSTSDIGSSLTSSSVRLDHVSYGYTYHVTTPDSWFNETSSNVTGNVTTSSAFYSTIEMAVLGLLAGTTSLVTILGNLVVILSFILERSIRQPTNYFIASLAVSDLLIGSISMPFYTVYLLAGQHWPLGEKLCDLWLSVDYTVCLCSIYTVFCITVDRFCSVIVPAKYRNWRTERKVLVIICITWTIPVLVFFTSIFGWQYFVQVRTVPEGKCYVQYMENAVFNAVLQVGYFWITLVVMCALYSGIYRVALRLQRRSEQKHRRTTTLVSVAGQAMTKIGISMSKQQQQQQTQITQADRVTSAAPITDRVQSVGPGCLDEEVASHRTTAEEESAPKKRKEEEEDDVHPEERSSSPAFSSDSDDKDSLKFSRSSTVDANDLIRKTTDSDAILPPYSDSCCVATASASSSASANKQLQQPLHPDLLQFGRKMQRISRLSEEILGSALSSVLLEPSAARDDDDLRLNDLDTNFNQSTDNVWLLRTRSTDADEANRDSSSMHSSPVWIRRSFLHQQQMPDAAAEKMHWIEDASLDRQKRRTLSTMTTLNALNRNHLQLTEKNRRHSNRLTSGCLRRKCAANSSYACVSVQDDVIMTSEMGCLKMEEAEGQGGGGGGREGKGESTGQLRFTATLRWFESLRQRFLSRTESSSSTDARTHPTAPTAAAATAAAAAAVGSDGGVRRGHSDAVGRASAGSAKTSKSEDRAMKALRTITIILGAFVLCWTPWHVLSMIIGFCPSCVLPVLYDISYWLCYLNSPINPFCYAFANLQFKRTFVRIFKLDWHRT